MAQLIVTIIISVLVGFSMGILLYIYLNAPELPKHPYERGILITHNQDKELSKLQQYIKENVEDPNKETTLKRIEYTRDEINTIRAMFENKLKVEDEEEVPITEKIPEHTFHDKRYLM